MHVLHHQNTDKSIIYQHCTYILDLSQHFSPSINSFSSRQERKISKTGLEHGVFLLHSLFYQKFSSIYQWNASSKFHSGFVSFFLHFCIKLIKNKLEPLPCKVSRKFSVGCGIQLFQYRMELPLVMLAYLRFMEQLHELTWLCQTKFKPNLRQYYIFYKNR